MGSELNRQFFVPMLPSGWLKSPGQESRAEIIVSRSQRPAMQRLLTRQDDDEEVYLGYPLSASITKSNSEICYYPIGLIPVDVDTRSASKTTLKISLRLNEVQINWKWLEYSFSRQE